MKVWHRDVVSVETSRSRADASQVSSRVSGHCVSSRRFVQVPAVHTVAAVRVILTSMTFCGLDIFVYRVFTLSFTYLS